MKNKVFILITVMCLSLIHLTSYAGFFNDSVDEAVKVKQEIDGLAVERNVTYLSGLNDAVERVRHAESVLQASAPFELWIQELLRQDQGDLDKNKLANVLLALRGWSYIYEAFLISTSEIKVDKSSISSALAKNLFQGKGSALARFNTWQETWNRAYYDSVEVLNREEYSVRKMKRGDFSGWKYLMKDIFEFTWVSPDARAEGMRPRYAVRMLKAYEGMNAKYQANEWYLMMRQYADMQDAFYRMRELRKKVIEHYARNQGTPGPSTKAHDENLAVLINYGFKDDLYFKKLDAVVRYEIFDAPVQNFCWHSILRCKGAQHWINDKQKMDNALLDFTSLKQFKFTVSPLTDEMLLWTRKTFKRNYTEQEYKEIEARVKIGKEWYDLFPKIKAPDSDKKFE